MSLLVLIFMVAFPITGGQTGKMKKLSLTRIQGELPLSEYFHQGRLPVHNLFSSEDDMRRYLKFQNNSAKAGLKVAEAKNLKELKISYARILASRLALSKIDEARTEVKEALRRGASQKEIVKLKLKKEKEIREERLEIMKTLGNRMEYQLEKDAYQKFLKLNQRLQKTLEDR